MKYLVRLLTLVIGMAVGGGLFCWFADAKMPPHMRSRDDQFWAVAAIACGVFAGGWIGLDIGTGITKD